jgi:prolyl-tRNA editing enzyme YbaK/EbsC (Cys-tRNA(Pro) deacylase)
MADEATNPPLGPSVRRVQEALAAAGGRHTVVALERPARTSAEAARAVGCRVDQIAKSLVFRGEHTQCAVLVITSGANRVDERRVAGLVAEPVARARRRLRAVPDGFRDRGALLRSRTPSR